MNKEEKFSVMRVLISLIFLVIPTMGIVWFLSAQTNAYLGYLNVNPWWQTLLFSAGMIAAFLLYSFRGRFIVTAGLMAFALFSGYKLINQYYTGEFDSYFVSVQYLLYTVIFCFSWLIGYGLARFRYFPIILSILVLTLAIILHTNSTLIHDMNQYLLDFLPVVVYGFYLIYTREVIQSMQEFGLSNLLKLTGRTLLFLIFLALFLFGANYAFEDKLKDLKEAVAQSADGKNDGKNQPQDDDDMMNRNGKDTTFNLKDYAQLKSRLGRNQELMFCAHLENYFPNTEVSNPLYFACYYLTKYNPQREVFELDSRMPSNDLFMPNPSLIPLYFNETDSSVIKNGKGDKFRQVAEVDVYVNRLSPSTFTAPGTAFFCQPIAVDDEFKDQFKSAYRAKSYISVLNSAYFVYNVDNPQIKAFQEQRFQELGTVKDYSQVDTAFYNYYTKSPKGIVFDSIANLAKTLIGNKKLPVDKVLAIRDYFLSKDDKGRPLYKYTLTPGNGDRSDMHGVQTTTNLSKFIFRTHKGYCTYFAGASLYLLRSVGIPCRMAAGFMTVDRADKNPGWYWFYGDQAHAWIQVYFPGYGWLDFDTTIGAEESRESPKPDGTPPTPPSKAWLAATGKLINITDSLTKTATIEVESINYHDKEFKLKKPISLKIDLKHAKIKQEKAPRRYSDLKENAQVLVISYDEKLKKLKPGAKDNLTTILAKLPKLVPIDEVHIRPEEKKAEATDILSAEEKKDLLKWGIIGSASLVILFLLTWLLLPVIVFTILKSKVKGSKTINEQTYNGNRLAEFLLNQLGLQRGNLTPLEFAKYKIDPLYGLSYEKFISVYHKVKYANEKPDEAEQIFVGNFNSTFTDKALVQFKTKHKLLSFISTGRTFKFLFGK